MALMMTSMYSQTAWAQTTATTAQSGVAAVTINIPAQSLAQALAELARQANVQVNASAALTAGKQAPAVSGNMTAKQALDRLLVGSGLESTVTGNQAVVRQGSGSAVRGNVSLVPVIVTGTKLDQGVQQATQGVSVFKPGDLVGLQNNLEIFQRVPNISYTGSNQMPIVRGLVGNGVAYGGGGAVTGSQPRMTSYVDGVARTYSAIPDGIGGLWDIGQVEVLRGAQSTTLGQNSLAGALVQVTNDPVFKDEYALQAGVRSKGATYTGAVMLNKTLGSNFAVRFAGQQSSGQGFIDYSNVTAIGLLPSETSELGKEKFKSYRLKALGVLGDTLVKFSIDQEKSSNAYPNDQSEIGVYGLRPPRAVTFIGTDAMVYALDVEHPINADWTFKSVLSKQKSLTSFTPPPVGSPDPAEYLGFTFDTNQWAFEPKLIYKPGNTRTSLVAGAYVTDKKRTDFGKPGTLFDLGADDKSSTQSLFADATVQINPQWDVLLGGRLVNDERKRAFTGFGGFLAFDFDRQDKLFLPKIGARYHFSPDASLSLLSYKGYTAGGGGVSFSTFTPYTYERETSQTVELVARSQWLDKKLTLNANLFSTDVNGYQASGRGPGGVNDSIYLNVAKVKTQGIEFDVTFAPTSMTNYGAAIGLLDAKIVDFGSAINSDRNGNKLASSPSVTANFYANTALTSHINIGTSLQYTGSRFSDFDNLAIDKLPSYVITNINAQYRVNQFTLEGYVTNLFDKKVETERFTSEGLSTVRRPRTLGVNVKVAF